LVCFEKDSLGPNIPNKQTIMSENHQLFYNGKMRKASSISIGKSIKYNGEILYNVLLEKHDKMMVHNLICETLHPENDIAKLHVIMLNMTPPNKMKIIKKYNMYMIKNKTIVPTYNKIKMYF
jgi:hypothetical protein